MTMRSLVLALLLANGIFLVWSQGWVRAYGFGPVQQTEPHRLENQIKPSALQVLSEQESQQLMAKLKAEKNPKACLQAGPFDAAQSLVLRTALEVNFAPEEWQLKAKSYPDRWIIYLGKFANPEALAKKKQELLSIQLAPQPLQNASLELGLSLGHFDTEALANEALLGLGKKGLRTGRVVLEKPAIESTYLIFNALTEPAKAKLVELTTALSGKPLQACDKAITNG